MLRKALWRISSWKVFARNACSAKDLKVLRSGVQSAKVSSRNRSRITQSRKAFVAARNAHQMRHTDYGFARVSVAVKKLQKANGVRNHVGAKRTKKDKKGDKETNLIDFAWIAPLQPAAIRNVQHAKDAEHLHAKIKRAQMSRNL